MLGAEEAREKALAACDFEDVVLGSARELDEGWHFPLVVKDPAVTAIIVNKHTAKALVVPARSSLDQDPSLYDRGWQFETYDVVVFTTEDVDATVRTLSLLREQVVEAFYESDRVSRIKRRLTDDEIRERLSSLPAVFWGSPVYDIDEFEKARDNGWFTFTSLEHRPRR